MKTTRTFAAALVFVAVFAAFSAPIRAGEKETIFCTGEERFVIHYPGKKSILLEHGEGKQVCVSMTELYLLTGLENVTEVLVWLDGKSDNGLLFRFSYTIIFRNISRNVITVTKQPKP